MRTDQELLTAFVTSRDERAFTELWERHRAMVMAMIRGVVGPRGESEDIAQEVFSEFARCASE
jgi:DNA-directed RNA polymerase specialized sigma24 family protein